MKDPNSGVNDKWTWDIKTTRSDILVFITSYTVSWSNNGGRDLTKVTFGASTWYTGPNGTGTYTYGPTAADTANKIDPGATVSLVLQFSKNNAYPTDPSIDVDDGVNTCHIP